MQRSKPPTQHRHLSLTRQLPDLHHHLLAAAQHSPPFRELQQESASPAESAAVLVCMQVDDHERTLRVDSQQIKGSLSTGFSS